MKRSKERGGHDGRPNPQRHLWKFTFKKTHAHEMDLFREYRDIIQDALDRVHGPGQATERTAETVANRVR